MVREKVSLNSNDLKPYKVKVFDMIVPILKMLDPKRGLPLGISLIAVASKK